MDGAQDLIVNDVAMSAISCAQSLGGRRRRRECHHVTSPTHRSPRARYAAEPVRPKACWSVTLGTVCGVVISRAGSRCTGYAPHPIAAGTTPCTARGPGSTSAPACSAPGAARTANWCPGHAPPAHLAADLTVDHVVPLAAGGAPFDPGNVAVLCRLCRRGDHHGELGGTGIRPRGDRHQPAADARRAQDAGRSRRRPPAERGDLRSPSRRDRPARPARSVRGGRRRRGAERGVGALTRLASHPRLSSPGGSASELDGPHAARGHTAPELGG